MIKFNVNILTLYFCFKVPVLTILFLIKCAKHSLKIMLNIILNYFFVKIHCTLTEKLLISYTQIYEWNIVVYHQFYKQVSYLNDFHFRLLR